MVIEITTKHDIMTKNAAVIVLPIAGTAVARKGAGRKNNFNQLLFQCQDKKDEDVEANEGSNILDNQKCNQCCGVYILLCL